jgi:F-type H+-transporting ATPase subunit delta
MITRTELAKVIGEQTLHVSDAIKLKQAIAGYLLEQNRVADIDSLMRDVMQYRAEHGCMEATVVSAYTLEPATRAEVMQTFKSQFPDAKSYVLNESIDPEVVGGIRLEMAGEELDMTIRAKLNTLKRLTAARDN